MRLEAIHRLGSLSLDQTLLLDDQPDLRTTDLVVYEVRERETGKLRQIAGPKANTLVHGVFVLPQGFHRTRALFGGVAVSISLVPQRIVTQHHL